MPQNERDKILIKNHTAFEERRTAAARLRDEIKLKIPIVIDGMNDTIGRSYSGWPDRIFIVDKEGKVAYRGEPGPRGFDPQSAQSALKALLKKR